MEVGTRPVPVINTATDTTIAADSLAVLRERADAWARLSIAGRIRHLRAIRARTIEGARGWVGLAALAKGIADSPLAGEEWLSGPYALLRAVDRLIRTLGEVARFGAPQIAPRRVRTRPDGQVIVEVFPDEPSDRILLSGVRAEVWMNRSVTQADLVGHLAAFYKQRDPRGTVTVVLGAGNVASIAPLDVLYALFAHGSVAMLKPNPVNAYLSPLYATIFSSLIEEGFVRIVDGGAEIGAYLCAHPAVDAIHITGSQRTHDAIARNGGNKTITSELGNVTPVIVVPGPWSEPDLAFQAAHVATQKLHNAGANCIAAQVLIVPRDWELTPRFVARVGEALADAPQRESYYPGSPKERTFVRDVDPSDENQPLFTTEVFGPVLAQTALPGDDAAAFLRNAVAFCNARLAGTLGASILIHPRTMAALGPAFEDAVADLRYGSVAINTWPGVAFTLAGASWGAFPETAAKAAGSGNGVVHNALLFDRPEKTVVRAPFAPFPRSLGDGERTLLPTPPWFVTHRRADAVGRLLFAYTAKPSALRMAATIAAAMRA